MRKDLFRRLAYPNWNKKGLLLVDHSYLAQKIMTRFYNASRVVNIYSELAIATRSAELAPFAKLIAL